MKNRRKEILKALNSVTQLGLSVAISFLLWILIAAWIRDKLALGNAIMILGVFLGAGSAILSFLKFCKSATLKENNHEK